MKYWVHKGELVGNEIKRLLKRNLILALQEASEHKAPGRWFVDSLKVWFRSQTFALDSLRVQLVKLSIFSAGRNNKDKLFFLYSGQVTGSLLAEIQVFVLQRLKQSWFCLACELAILQRFEFVMTGELSVLRLSFPRFL